jgi:hypothetical protein
VSGVLGYRPVVGRRADPFKVLAAQLSGAAAGYAHVKRCTREEALAEIAETLAGANVRPGSDRAVAALTEAAASYVGEPLRAGDSRWHREAAALLGEAGADLERAEGDPARARCRHVVSALSLEVVVCADTPLGHPYRLASARCEVGERRVPVRVDDRDVPAVGGARRDGRVAARPPTTTSPPGGT